VNLFVPPEDARLWQEMRPADAGAYIVTIKPARDLSEAERSSWARLTGRAGGNNVFSTDWFMASAIRHCAPPAGVKLAIVRTLDGEWIGVLPVTFERWFGRCPLPGWQSWHSANQFDHAPLIERGAEHIFWHCLLAQLDRKPGAALALCLEGVPLDDPATAALIEVCLASGRALHRTGGFTRPMRAPGPPSPQAQAARAKLDKRLDALTRKLEREVGAVEIAALAPVADPAAWVEQFLALEQSGWKGSSASALASQAATAKKFRQVIRIAHQQGMVRLMSLSAAGQVIAMTTWFVGSARACGFKMAYDEAFRSYAPGRLLMRAVADTSAAEHPALAFDSCARADARPDPLWPDAREFAHYAISIGGPARRSVLAGAMRACQVWRQV
jgi:CelD/BcsL family acetyltransferase involved in cellulose biosynthesis